MSETYNFVLLETIDDSLKIIQSIRSTVNNYYNSTELFGSNYFSDVMQDSSDESMVLSREAIRDFPSEWMTLSPEEIRVEILNLSGIQDFPSEWMTLSPEEIRVELLNLSGIQDFPTLSTEEIRGEVLNSSREEVQDIPSEWITLSTDAIGADFFDSPDESTNVYTDAIQDSPDESTNVYTDAIQDSPDESMIFSHEGIQDSHESMDSEAFQNSDYEAFENSDSDSDYEVILDSDSDYEVILDSDSEAILDSDSEATQNFDSEATLNVDILLNIIRLFFPQHYTRTNISTFMTVLTDLIGDPVTRQPLPKEILESLPIKTVDEKIMNELEICVICSEKYSLEERVLLLPCKHVFHATCIERWFVESSNCPMCRQFVGINL